MSCDHETITIQGLEELERGQLWQVILDRTNLDKTMTAELGVKFLIDDNGEKVTATRLAGDVKNGKK